MHWRGLLLVVISAWKDTQNFLYVPQNNRSQLVQTESNTLIVDAYNANPTSMMAALVNFRQMEAEHKAAILGAMKELGEGSREESIRK